jgi:hypothetical protein
VVPSGLILKDLFQWKYIYWGCRSDQVTSIVLPIQASMLNYGIWGCRFDQVTSVILPIAGLATGLYFWVSGEYKLILLKGDN